MKVYLFNIVVAIAIAA